MFGLFGGKPPTSPKLVPGGFPAIPEERKRPKMGTLDKIGILGGMISDTFGGSGNAQRMSSLAQDKVAQLAFEQEQERKLALVRQAMGGAGRGGGQPMDARTAALWQLNPDAMSKAASEHYGFNSFQHDNRVGVIGADGAMRHHDLGASHADMNTRLGHEVTREGNHLDYGQAQFEDATKRRGQDVDVANNIRTTDAARMGHQLGYDASIYGSNVSSANSQRAYDADMAAVGVDRGRLALDTAKYTNPGEGERKPFAGAQAQAAGFYDRAQGASTLLDEIEASGYSHGRAERIPGRGDNQRKYEAAMDEWIAAKLRKESGAAIGKDERKAERDRYFPQPFDSPEVREQKRQLRQRAEEALRIESQGAYEALYGGQMPTAPQDISRMSIADLERIANGG